MILMHVAGAATPGRASSACRLPLHDRACTAGVWPAALGRRACPAAGVALTGGEMRAAEVWPAVLGQSICPARLEKPERTKQDDRYNGNLQYYVFWWEGKSVQ
jgi:hypothetical protein